MLEVGEVGTEVTVQSAAPVIETDVPSIADVRSLRELKDLPLNIRSTVSGTENSGLYRYVFLTPMGYQGGGSRFCCVEVPEGNGSTPVGLHLE
jgi:hypothetical protein